MCGGEGGGVVAVELELEEVVDNFPDAPRLVTPRPQDIRLGVAG